MEKIDRSIIYESLIDINEEIKYRYDRLYLLEIDDQKNTNRYSSKIESLKQILSAEDEFYDINRKYLIRNSDYIIDYIEDEDMDGISEEDILVNSGDKACLIRIFTNLTNIVDSEYNSYFNSKKFNIYSCVNYHLNSNFSLPYISLIQERIDKESNQEVRESLIKYKYNYLYLDVNLSNQLIEYEFDIPSILEIGDFEVSNNPENLQNFISEIYILMSTLSEFTDKQLNITKQKEYFNILIAYFKLMANLIKDTQLLNDLKVKSLEMFDDNNNISKNEVCNIYDEVIDDQKRYWKK